MFNVENRFRSNGVYRVQCVIVALSCFLVFRYTGSFLYVPLIETGVIILAIVSFAIASKRSQGSLTVFSVNIIPIYINCFSGLYLTDSRLSISNVASAFVGVLLASLWILNRNTKGVYQRLTVICIIAIMFTVLLLAYREYQHMRTEVSYAPVGQPWRSLYFASWINSSFLRLYCIMQLLCLLVFFIATNVSPLLYSPLSASHYFSIMARGALEVLLRVS